MPKTSTHPVIINELIKIRIRDLRLGGFLENSIKTEGICFGDNWGNIVAEFQLTVDSSSNDCYAEFNYQIGGKSYTQVISLIYKTSDFGKGIVWYFYFTELNKKFRTLYFLETEFVPKEKISEPYYYSNQILSKRAREIDSLGDKIKKSERLVKELKKPYAKPRYSQEFTGKMKQLIQLNKQLRYQ